MHFIVILAVALALAVLLIPSWRPFLILELEDGSYRVYGSKPNAEQYLLDQMRRRRQGR
jgi:hypothetical protein